MWKDDEGGKEGGREGRRMESQNGIDVEGYCVWDGIGGRGKQDRKVEEGGWTKWMGDKRR